MAMDAQLWTEAVELREAYEEGLAQVAEDSEMRERLARRARELSER